jgi:putative ABC transport system substrate-binding protein
MALLVNPANPSLAAIDKELQAAARILGLRLHVLNASAQSDFDGAFAKLVELRAGALVIGGDPFFTSWIERLAALSIQYAVPAIYQSREFVVAGGLLSYGTDFRETFRLAGNYTGRILNGDKPADLPVQQATKVELVINLKTAKALGLEIPPTLLARADEVIE